MKPYFLPMPIKKVNFEPAITGQAGKYMGFVRQR